MSAADDWTESVCTRLTTAQKDEIAAFIKHAQRSGIVFKNKEDVRAICDKYWEQKKKALTRESVTGGLRSLESYTRSAKEIVKLVTIQKGVLPVGSFKYNVHKYASDIDIMERLNICCSVAEAKRQVAAGIQRIGRLIRSAPDVYLGDFKAGKDDRFAIDIGAWIPEQDVRKPGAFGTPPIAAAATKRDAVQKEPGILAQIGQFLGLSSSDDNDRRPQNIVEKTAQALARAEEAATAIGENTAATGVFAAFPAPLNKYFNAEGQLNGAYIVQTVFSGNGDFLADDFQQLAQLLQRNNLPAPNNFEDALRKALRLHRIYQQDLANMPRKRWQQQRGYVEDGLVLVGFSPSRIRERINQLAGEKLISFATQKRLLGLLESQEAITKEQWEELQALLREHQVLRWNPQEMSQGYKMLPGFRKLTLEEALGQKTLVKIDAWARVNGRWLEVTNFFIISAVDASGNVIEQLTQEMPDYVKNMSKDVKFYSSAEHRKTLKALKRLWALSLFKNDLALANRINPLFSGKAAAFNQIVGDAEVLSGMLEKLDDPPLEQIMEEIDGFKLRIDQLNEITNLNPQLFQLVNSIVEPFYAKPVNEYIDFDQAIDALGKIQELVGGAVEQMIYTDAANAGLDNPAQFV